MTGAPRSTGIILSGAYITNGMISEFGLIPPSFLPLANKRLYCWQVEKLKAHTDSIMLVVPENFQIEFYDQNWLEERNVRIVCLGEGKTLGAAIHACLPHVEKGVEDIWLLFGDTLLTNFDVLPRDSVGVGYVQEHSRWGYCRQTEHGTIEFSESYDTSETDKQPIVVGCFRFIKQQITKCLDLSEKNFYSALNLYSTKYGLKLANIGDGWHDFGHINAYFRSRQHFTTERSFNNLCIENRKVCKYSEETFKILAEAAWYEGVPRDIDVFLPGYLGRIKQGNNAGYAMEYLFLPPASDLYVYGRLPEYVWRQILSGCREFLEVCASYRSRDEVTSDVRWLYEAKTKERLQAFCQNRGISLQKPWIFNGQPVPSLEHIFQRALAIIAPPTPEHTSITHGDFHFANIFFDFRSLGVKVVDPRGIICNVPTIYGDYRYDLAKLTHSINGLYDFILAGIFKAEFVSDYNINFTITKNNQIDMVQKLFASMSFNGLSPCDLEIQAIVILLFLSMLPLHDDDPSRQNTLLANAFRLFLEMEQEAST